MPCLLMSPIVSGSVVVIGDIVVDGWYQCRHGLCRSLGRQHWRSCRGEGLSSL